MRAWMLNSHRDFTRGLDTIWRMLIPLTLTLTTTPTSFRRPVRWVPKWSSDTKPLVERKLRRKVCVCVCVCVDQMWDSTADVSFHEWGFEPGRDCALATPLVTHMQAPLNSLARVNLHQVQKALLSTENTDTRVWPSLNVVGEWIGIETDKELGQHDGAKRIIEPSIVCAKSNLRWSSLLRRRGERQTLFPNKAQECSVNASWIRPAPLSSRWRRGR